MRFALILGITLVGYWLTLSGFLDNPLLLVFGALSITVTLILVSRMKIMDGETVPYLSIPQTLMYFVWLFKEIVKANVQVVRAVLSPSLEVSPTLVKIPSDRATDIGKVMFANSITLTPGTVSVDMQEDHILVHALLSEMSDPEDFVEMQSRAGWSVGEPVTPSEQDFLEKDQQARGTS